MNPAELFRLETDTLVLRPGEILFGEGDPPKDMFVLLEGEADVTIGAMVVERSQPGALLGEMAMIEDSPRSATVVATKECRFVRISQKRFAFLVQQTPFFAIHVMKVLVERLRAMNRRMPSETHG